MFTSLCVKWTALWNRRFRHLRSLSLCALMVAALAINAEAAVITGETATASSEYDAIHIAPKVIDDSSISGPGGSLATDGNFVHSIDHTGMWLTASGSPLLDTLTVNLGTPYDLDGMRIWNYNEDNSDAGVALYDLETSPDGSIWTLQQDDATLAQGPNPAVNGYVGVYTAVSWTNVQFVRLTVLDTYRPADDVAGLSEMMFSGVLSVPEPDALILTVIGGIGLLSMGRRCRGMRVTADANSF